ncbi:MAG: diguanylate cyclase [Vicinamibacterales bacterium]
MRVLVADDDRLVAEILSRTLKRWHYEVTVVADGADAWSYLQTAAASAGPTLAILDWMMPKMDGVEICRRVRHELPLANMYLILLTALESRKDVVAGLEAGADDYIVKPFDTEELHARVRVGIRVLTLQERLGERVAELQAARDEFAQLANTDVLTGLASRRRWFEVAAIEFGRSRRHKRPVGVLMADLDFFKRVNDTFGHDTGDAVLKTFADVLRQHSSRGSDLAGRVGGEEFAVLLPETPIDAAQEVARRIVDNCRTRTVSGPAGQVGFTCSVGVTEIAAADDSIEATLRRADAALYEAKRSGRDRISVLPAGSASAPAGAA